MATANGLEVSTHGRIASTVLQAYENRGNTVVATPAAELLAGPSVQAEAKPKRRTRKKTAEG